MLRVFQFKRISRYFDFKSSPALNYFNRQSWPKHDVAICKKPWRALAAICQKITRNGWRPHVEIHEEKWRHGWPSPQIREKTTSKIKLNGQVWWQVLSIINPQDIDLFIPRFKRFARSMNDHMLRLSRADDGHLLRFNRRRRWSGSLREVTHFYTVLRKYYCVKMCD